MQKKNLQSKTIKSDTTTHKKHTVALSGHIQYILKCTYATSLTRAHCILWPLGCHKRETWIYEGESISSTHLNNIDETWPISMVNFQGIYNMCRNESIKVISIMLKYITYETKHMCCIKWPDFIHIPLLNIAYSDLRAIIMRIIWIYK